VFELAQLLQLSRLHRPQPPLAKDHGRCTVWQTKVWKENGPHRLVAEGPFQGYFCTTTALLATTAAAFAMMNGAEIKKVVTTQAKKVATTAAQAANGNSSSQKKRRKGENLKPIITTDGSSQLEESPTALNPG
jgi:hypothetical protein